MLERDIAEQRMRWLWYGAWLLSSGAFVGLGLLAANSELEVIGGMAASITIVFLLSYSSSLLPAGGLFGARLRGLAVERAVIKSVDNWINGMPPGSGWRLYTNEMIDHLGDADLVVVAPGEKKFVFEIKSARHCRITVRDEVSVGSDEGVDAAAQVRRLARALSAAPMIWLPLADARPMARARDVGIIFGWSGLREWSGM